MSAARPPAGAPAPRAAAPPSAPAGPAAPARRRRVKLLWQLLAALLLVGVGPLVISSRMQMQINQTTLESGILTSHTQLVSATAEGVRAFVGRATEALLGIARFQGLAGGADGRSQDLLIPFLDSYEFLLALRLVDAAGGTVAEVSRAAGVLPGGGAGVAAALRGQVSYGNPAAAPGAGAATMEVAVPVKDEAGRVTGALVAAVSLAEVQDLIATVRAGSAAGFLVDRRGVVIAHPDLELVRRGEDVSDLEIVGYIQGGQTGGSVPFRDRQGREMLGAYAVVPGVGWGVVIQEPRDEAYRPLHDMRRQTVLWVAIGALLAVVIGAFIAHSVSRPIRTFAEKSLAIARGDFKGRIAVRSSNEIGQLADTFNHMTEQLDLYDRNMRELFLSTIKSLAAAIDAKDPYTRGHSERVTTYAVGIARELGLDEKSLERVQIAALLHDVGKIGIQDAVLLKPTRLTDEEFAVIKRHPALGASIMGPIRQLRDIIPGMRHHHEALDGTGYPDGLAGGEIPLMARIIAVADTFDAMTSERLYQKAMDDEHVIGVLRKLSGTRYDPKAVQAFIKAHPRLRPGHRAAAAPAAAAPPAARATA